MMKAVATVVETAERAPGQAPVQPLYLEALTLVERLHRRLLDVIKDEFDRRGRADINSVQALLLYNIGDKELTAGELRGNLLVTLSGRSHLLRECFEFQPTCFGMRQRLQTKREHEALTVNEELQEVLCPRA